MKGFLIVLLIVILGSAAVFIQSQKPIYVVGQNELLWQVAYNEGVELDSLAAKNNIILYKDIYGNLQPHPKVKAGHHLIIPAVYKKIHFGRAEIICLNQMNKILADGYKYKDSSDAFVATPEQYSIGSWIKIIYSDSSINSQGKVIVSKKSVKFRVREHFSNPYLAAQFSQKAYDIAKEKFGCDVVQKRRILNIESIGNEQKLFMLKAQEARRKISRKAGELKNGASKTTKR